MTAKTIVATGTVTIKYGSKLVEIHPFKVLKTQRAGKVRFEYWVIPSGCKSFRRFASSPTSVQRLLDFVKNGTVNMLAMTVNHI